MLTQFEFLMKRAMWLLVILFVARCFLSSQEIIQSFSLYSLFGYAGEAISVTAIIMAAYNKWLWKIDPTIKTPVLKRQYKGTIRSSYNNQIYEAKLEIRQSPLNVSVILKTQESTSKSIMASIENILGEQQLIYIYLNTPIASVRSRSAIHYGAATLSIENPIDLTGLYFTDRNTTGDIHFVPE